ncbi:MAG: aminotransferase class V-fold PLP-dependent enzyme [Burkholderiales bacterium]|nr:aminotransferase class V-fold PLP-dependent enzyme [Phycisphaerae bacterium]
MRLTYLDNNATTMPAPEVVAEMNQYLTDYWGNPSSAHRFGQRARQGVDIARQQLADLVGVEANDIWFAGGGTEAVNTNIRNLLASRGHRKKIITSTVEHSATRELGLQLEREGYQVVRIGVDRQGDLDLSQLLTEVDDDTALVSMIWANNETGVVFPVDQIVAICHGCGVPFHTDATQAVGKIVTDFRAAGVDSATFASHKFHGPKGLGIAYARKGLRVRPMILGGPQERGRRGGTENVPGIVGAGKAAELAKAALADAPAIAAKRDRLQAAILQSIDEAHVNGSLVHRVPNTTNIGFSRLQSEAILLLLSEQGICASAGAACSSGSLEPSHVMRAMKVPDVIAHGAVRFSLSRYTTDEEINRCIEVLPAVINKLRAVLPVSV